MGGCASKPREFNSTPATLPGENPVFESTPKNVEVDILILQEVEHVDEPQKEEPLVDLSEPVAETSNAEGKAVSAEPANAAIDDLISGIVAQPTAERHTWQRRKPPTVLCNPLPLLHPGVVVTCESNTPHPSEKLR